jgi:hypothetical protein
VTLLGVALGLGLAACLLVRSRLRLEHLLAATAVFAGSAAINVGGNSVSPFFVVASLIAALAGALLLGIGYKERAYRDGRLFSGHPYLLVFLLWCVLVTLVAPSLFVGVRVLSPRGGTDSEVAFPSYLDYSLSNLIQVAYLALCVLIVLHIGHLRGSVKHLLSIAFAVGLALSTMRLVSAGLDGLIGPLIDNSQNVNYVSFTSTGERRFRGIFPEPSLLASFSTASIAYFASRLMSDRGYLSAFSCAGLLLGVANFYASASGTAVVGGALVLIVAVVAGGVRLFRRDVQLRLPLMFAFAAGFIVMIFYGTILLSPFEAIVAEKIGSSSFETRSTADAFSLGIMSDTGYLGAGLGSSRPSSFWPMLLSTVGAVGSLLFIAVVYRVLRPAFRNTAYRPAAWALLSLLICKSVAGPNLAEPMLWLALGVCFHAALAQADAKVEALAFR